MLLNKPEILKNSHLQIIYTASNDDLSSVHDPERMEHPSIDYQYVKEQVLETRRRSKDRDDRKDRFYVRLKHKSPERELSLPEIEKNFLKNTIQNIISPSKQDVKTINYNRFSFLQEA